MHAIHFRAVPSLLAAAALVSATAAVHADQAVVVQGTVHDQYGKPPRLPLAPSSSVDTVQIAQIDATLLGTVRGDGLHPRHPDHVALELFSETPHSSRGGRASDWLSSSEYKTRAAPGTWSRADAMQSNDGGYEARLDARVPFVVAGGSSRADWNLPSFSFEDPACQLPHTCSLSAHASGWLPDAPVDIYLVSQSEFPNGRPTGWFAGYAAISSPEQADRQSEQIVAQIQPDADGRFDGPVSGEAQVTVASIDSHQMSSFAAVQRAPGIFKMAQPTTGFSLPAFDPFVLLQQPTPSVPSDSGDAPDTPAGDSAP